MVKLAIVFALGLSSCPKLAYVADLGADLPAPEVDQGVESTNYSGMPGGALTPGYYQLGCGFDACEPPPAVSTQNSTPNPTAP